MHLIFNDLSLQTPAATKDEARSRLQKLYDTVSAAIEAGRLEWVLLVHEAFPNADLAPQYTLLDWLDDHSVDKPLREAVQALITQAPFLDELCTKQDIGQYHVGFQQDYGFGIHLAAYRGHPVASLCVPRFEQDPIRVTVVRGSADHSDEDIVNFHSPQSVRERLPWLDAHLLPKPNYVHAEHHDPSSGKFRGGGSMTSTIPDDAQQVYEQAVADELGNPGASWWGLDSEGYLYRYGLSHEGGQYRAHWNGSNRPGDGRKFEDRIVPRRIREAFPHRKMQS